MNTWINPRRLLGIALPVIAIMAIACGGAAAPAPSTGQDTTPEVAAHPQEPESQERNIQTSFVESPDEVASITPSAPAQQALDPDAVVAAFEQVLNSVHEETLPSVVHIRVAQRVSPQGQVNPFDFGFGQSPQGQEPPEDFFFRSGEGSGFIWSEEGYIVTNQHVVANADRVTVTFSDETVAEAQVLGGDPDSDIAVLKVDLPSDRLQPVQLGDSDEVMVGQLAIAIGNPFGQEFTTTSGIVSAVGRTIRSGNTEFSIPRVIQTDAPINPGNSGGPLLDRQGRVIGINTQIISRTGASSGIGFAVPINTAKQVIPALIEHGEYEYAWLGISGITLHPEVAELMDIPADTKGAQVMELAPGGPAEQAGLRGSDRTLETDIGLIPVGGDVIVAVDGTPITSMDDLIVYLIDNTSPGDQVTMNIIREGGESAQIQVTLGTRPHAG